jgi:hypothetical protein
MRVTLSANILGTVAGEQIEDISLGLNDKERLISEGASEINILQDCSLHLATPLFQLWLLKAYT